MNGQIYGYGDVANIVPFPGLGSINVAAPIPSLNSSNNPMLGLLLGGGLGLLGGLFNAFSQRSANRQNKQMMYEQMEWSEQQAAKQMNWQRDMWNAQNAYNTPAAQRKRLEDAGINPYLAMGNISTGTATSSPSGAQASLPSAPTVQPIQLSPMEMLQGVASMQMLQRQGLENQALKEDIRAKRRENNLGDKTFDYDVSIKDMMANMAAINYNIASLDYGIKQTIAKYSDDNALLDLAAKRIHNALVGQQFENEKERNEQIKQAAKQLRLSNDQVEKTVDAIDALAVPIAKIFRMMNLDEESSNIAGNFISKLLIGWIVGKVGG